MHRTTTTTVAITDVATINTINTIPTPRKRPHLMNTNQVQIPT